MTRNKTTAQTTSDTIKFYQNNFINNNQIETFPENSNPQDYGATGNYWNNYTGVDTDNNGIEKSPSIIDKNNQDNYPLMNPVNISEIPEHPSWIILPILSIITLYAKMKRKKMFHQRS